MRAFTEVYSKPVIKNITAVARKNVFIFALSAAAFAAICIAFCVLTAFDYVNAYLGCALNCILTVAFLWYGYLFFTVYSAPARKRYGVIKFLENAQPALFSGEFVSKEDGGACYALTFGDTAFSLDKSCAFDFVAGTAYELKTVNGFIVAVREAAYE